MAQWNDTERHSFDRRTRFQVRSRTLIDEVSPKANGNLKLTVCEWCHRFLRCSMSEHQEDLVLSQTEVLTSIADFL